MSDTAPRPNNENIRLWIDALRSGEFAQTKHRLTVLNKDGTKSYCCLGVACEIAVKNGLDIDVVVGGNDSRVYYNNSYGTLPAAVGEWLGGVSGYGRVFINGELTFLADLNDDENYTFEQIADVIEQNWLSEDSNA